MNFRSQYLLAAAVGVVVACASSGGGGESVRPDSRLINRAELDQLTEMGVRNLHEAVSRVRPRWLQVRAGTRSFYGGQTAIPVFQDQTLLGGPELLERMGLEGVFELRYLDASTAQATLAGIQDSHISHAIVVYMRPPG
ncbi:MAG: hypothetical protein JSW71_16875 [Gemmatimonadota bacterium]|nr:MAG: hypothetical protein JSW71_16875 [Gemmatimonadota bacterium]